MTINYDLEIIAERAWMETENESSSNPKARLIAMLEKVNGDLSDLEAGLIRACRTRVGM